MPLLRVLIVGKTRQGGGACIGGITSEGRSVRLICPDPRDERWGLVFDVGEVWEVEAEPAARVVPPHVENVIVRSRHRVGAMEDPISFIARHIPPSRGGPERLFEGRVRARASGALQIAERTGVPSFSTTFWRPDRPLRRDESGKRIRYVYDGPDGARSLVFVGFQEPEPEIPAGTLLRVSLSHWWHPPDRPDEPYSCYVQLSGWFAASASCGGGRDGMNPRAARRDESASLQFPPGCPRPEGHPAPAQVIGEASARPGIAEARRVMEHVFGYREFRPLQEAIVASALAGRDTLAVMPTGAGKSLCYQLPALLLQGLTVVVSPLLALMQDQVSQLARLGVRAETLNSMLGHGEYVEAARRVRAGEARLLYVAPETLLRPEVLLLLEQSRLGCLAVDEAHCISEWGHDFRPEYRRLREIRDRSPRAVCLAFTATATARVREDIQRSLGIDAGNTYVAPFDRPNLVLGVQDRHEDGFAQLLELVARHPGEAGILYCNTREHVDRLVQRLAGRGIRALPYHAGLDDVLRREHQRRFEHDRAPLVVATIAFGMGINRPDLRFIGHESLPDCLETYYQQVGRAGRDGAPAECLLLFSPADVDRCERLIQQADPSQRPGRGARLQAVVRFAETTACRRRALLPYFGDPPPAGPCGMCDNCLAQATAPSREIGEAFRSGVSLSELEARWGVKREMILGHLAAYIRSGGRVNPGRLLAECRLSPDDREAALRLFAQLGHERLGPVHAVLGGRIPHDELRLLQLYVLSLGFGPFSPP